MFREDLKDAGVVFDFSAFTKADDALDFLRQREKKPVLVLTDLSLADEAALRLIEECQEFLHGGAVGVYSRGGAGKFATAARRVQAVVDAKRS